MALKSDSFSPLNSPLNKAFIFLGLGGGCLFFYWNFQKHDPIKKIHILREQGQSYLKTEEIVSMSKIKKDQRYTYKELNSIASLLQKHPAILFASLKQKANILYIHLKERECVAIVENKANKTVYDIDAEGRIFSLGEEGEGGASRCKQVPLLRGNFSERGNSLEGENIKRLLHALSRIKKAYPRLSARFSEIRVNSDASLTFFVLPAYLRIDMPFALDSMMIRRLYASVAYLSSQKVRHAWLDLRGPEALLHTKAN